MAYAETLPVPGPDKAPVALRVDRLFAATWAAAARRPLAYLALVLAFGVAPTAIACALFGLTPADLGRAAVGPRLVSMALFVLGDAALGGALARLALGETRLLAFSPRAWAALIGVAAVLDIPMLTLNLISGLIAHDAASGLALYALRFGVGVSLNAVWCGAAAAVVFDRLDARAALSRAAAVTHGRRFPIALFVAAFFVLKVLGPYLLIDIGLQALAPWVAAPALAWAGVLVWNLLACSLGIAAALIWAVLSRPADA